MKEYTRELVEFLHGLTPDRLPPEVLDRARYFLLDYLACAIRGSQEESSQAVQRMVQRMGANGCASVIGTRIRTIPGLAAMANGAATHGIEQDDTHSGGSIHLGATMFSAALALAETMPDLSMDEFLAAVVAGFEAAARIAMAVQPKEHYALGFHMTPTCGVFGAAITTAKLLRLTPEQTLNAAGIAGSMAAGSMEFLAEGAWTKRIHPGLASRNGMEAALLAAEGFSGPQHILEGRDGFLHGYSRNPIAERLTDGLGESFEILHTAVKPHACCRYMQGPIDAILALTREHNLDAAGIERIEVAVLQAGWGIVADPREKKFNPESVVDAQFSMPFGAAVAVMDGAAGLDQFTIEKIRSPKVREFMKKVTLNKDPRIEETFPREWPAVVTIEVAGGQRYEKFVRFPKGDPENPLTWDEMKSKFRTLATSVISSEHCDDVIEAIAHAKPAHIPSMCV
ncbi:MAG TPA: MmgE/PrpD family protein [Bryobacteraceae bacterium]|nr:MmgE/PrpD family protein [Bryobacteraceae bacterium]